MACPGILGGYDLQTMGFFDCNCCYEYWEGCSWGECSTLANSGGSSGGGDGSPPPISTPTYAPSYSPTYAPTFTPTKTPTFTPTKTPTFTPTKTPTFTPTKTPTFTPTKTPTFTPTKTPTQLPTNVPTYESSSSGSSFAYIIGGFNMFIAILSALHTFLKYDALEDRHHQYSRHFGALEVDIETLLAKPHSQRGNAITVVENYKTKYAVLINNAPDLPEKLEMHCSNDNVFIVPTNIELT